MIPGAKSPAESQAVIALIQAQGNPDATIKAAEDLLSKFADSTFKETALFTEAQAYKDKKDNEKATIYAEKTLEVNPKSFQAMLLLGEILATTTRENDLDKEEKLTKADKYFNGAIDAVKTAAKPNPQLTDAQWEDGKKWVTAQAHSGIGQVAMTRKKYDVAATEFKSANDLDPQATYAVKEAAALHDAGKNDEAVAILDKVLADPQLHPQIKAVAESIKKQAAAAKK